MDRSRLRKILINRIGIPLEEEMVYAGEISTSYLAAGAGEPVLLIHGHSSSGAICWGSVITSLSPTFRVIAPDIVGYGESGKPSAPYDKSFFVTWLKNFLDALNLDEVSLVGTSLGGSIVSHFTLDYPERVNRMVLVNPAGFGHNFSFGFLLSTLWRNTFPSRLASKWHRRYMVTNSNEIDKEMVDYGLKVTRMHGGRRAFWQGRGRAVYRIPHESLCRIMQPTLFIHGNRDPVIPLSSLQIAQQIMPNAQLHSIPEGGHSPFLDHPDLFNEILFQFLNGEFGQ